MRAIAFVVMTLPIGCNPYAENWFSAGGGIVFSGTIVALDTERREITIRDEDGDAFTVPAGPKVRNLSRLAVGDKVEVWYEPPEILAFFDPEDRSKGLISSSYSEQMSYGDTKPVLMVVTILDGMMIRTPDGFTRVAGVDNYLESYAEGLRPGDRVEVALDWREAVKVIKVSRN
jgi:hypothetical protein